MPLNTSDLYMILMRKYKFFIVLLILLAAKAETAKAESSRRLQNDLLTSPAIRTARSTQMTSQCGTITRNNLVDAYGVQGGFQYSDSFSRIFPIDRTAFDNFLQFDIMAINSTLKTHTAGYVLFVVTGLTVMALLLVAAPVMHTLLFCPFEGCLRNKLQYSQCEQLWPAAIVLILGMGVLAGSAVGMLSSHRFYPGYQDLSCSGTMLFDDALNGNAKSDGSSFFTGTVNIAKTAKLLDQNYEAIYGNISRVSSSEKEIGTSSELFGQALQDVGKIPDSNGNKLTLVYPAPLLSYTTSTTIESTFSTTLGTSSNSGSLVGNVSDAIQSTKSSLDDIKAKADLFMMTKPYSKDLLAQLTQKANSTSSDIFSGLLQIDDLFKTHRPPSFTQHLEIIVYGTIMLFVGLLIVSQVCLVKWDRIWCRHFIYILGFFLFFITLAALAASVILTFVSAVSYSGCNYLDRSISSPQSFQSSLSSMGLGSYGAQLLSVCLEGQSGNFISSMSGQSTSAYLGNASAFMSSLANFDSKGQSELIYSEYQALQTSILHYSRAEILDINNEAAIKDILYVSNPTNYPSCTRGLFQTDSWIPSIHQQDSAIPCAFTPLSSFNTADASTCPSPLAFQAPVSGCTGCMDTFSLLGNQTSRESTLSYLSSRYSDCPQFNSQLSNLWNNFYLVKKQSFEGVHQREITARQSVSNARQYLLTTVEPLMESTVENLYSASESGLNPKYGALSGLNCQVLGQDIALLKSVLCRTTFSYSYFHCILLLALGIALSLLLCCNTCLLFRKKKEILDAVNWPEDEPKVRAEVAPQTAGRLRSPYW